MMTPLDWMRLSLKTGMMLGQAQMVIGMRLWGMAGMWSVLPSENARMVAEKLAAGIEATGHAATAAMRGKGPAAVAAAALAPVARRTKSNARRLARRGPKISG